MYAFLGLQILRIDLFLGHLEGLHSLLGQLNVFWQFISTFLFKNAKFIIETNEDKKKKKKKKQQQATQVFQYFASVGKGWILL